MNGRGAVLWALAALWSSCRTSEGPPDAGVAPPQSLLEHVELRAEAMPDARFRAQLFAELGVGLVARAPEQGRALLDRATTAARAVTAQEDRDIALESVTVAFSRAALYPEASALIPGLANAERRGRAGRAVAEALALRGDFARAEAMAAAIPDPVAKGEAYAELGCALARAGDLERASTLGRKAMSADDSDRVLAAIAVEHAKRRAYQTAESALERVLSARWKSEAEAAFAVEYARRGLTQRAKDKLKVIESAPVRVRAHFLVARVWHGQGKRAQASGLGARAREIAEGIGDPALRAAAAEALARLTLEDGAVKEAEALAGNSGSREVERRVVALVVAKRAREGALVEAARAARAIADDPLSGADALGAVGVAQAEAGQVGTALATLAEIQNLELRLPHLARAVLAAGDSPPPAAALAALDAVLR